MSTTPARPLTADQRASLAALLGDDAKPATNKLLMDFGDVIRQRREHDHPKWEDLFCLNLVSYMGERMVPVLRRLLDLEAENAQLRGDDSTPLAVRWDRLVMHPTGDDEHTIVACLTDAGTPVALFLDEELREALGLQLVDPHPDDEEATEAPDFFEPGRMYAQQSVNEPCHRTWTFDVRTVEEAPNGTRTALGFITGESHGTGVWTVHGEESFDRWVDVTDELDGDETEGDEK
jgi:hypothetical protein